MNFSSIDFSIFWSTPYLICTAISVFGAVWYIARVRQELNIQNLLVAIFASLWPIINCVTAFICCIAFLQWVSEGAADIKLWRKE